MPPTDAAGVAAALSRLDVDPGLCARCRNLRLVSSPRSTFVRCALAETDPAFARYPRLPVLLCAGFAAGAPPTLDPGGL